jgi:hypothetical protein
MIFATLLYKERSENFIHISSVVENEGQKTKRLPLQVIVWRKPGQMFLFHLILQFTFGYRIKSPLFGTRILKHFIKIVGL